MCFNHSVSQSVCQSVSQSGSQSVSESVSLSVSQSVSQSVRQSGSQSVSQSVNLVPRGPFCHALEIGTPGQVQRHSSFEWLCKHNRVRPEPIRFDRLNSEHAQSDGKSVNRGLPVLDLARGRGLWEWDCQSVRQTGRQSVCLSVSHLVCQSVCQSVSLLVGSIFHDLWIYEWNQSANPSVGQSVKTVTGYWLSGVARLLWALKQQK